MRPRAKGRGWFRESFVILRPTDQPRQAYEAQRDLEGSRIAPRRARHWTFDIERFDKWVLHTNMISVSGQLQVQVSPLVVSVQQNQSVGTGGGYNGTMHHGWHQRPCRNEPTRSGTSTQLWVMYWTTVCRERGALCMAGQTLLDDVVSSKTEAGARGRY